MLLLALSAAGLLVGPQPDLKKISPDTYPTAMLRANKSVSAQIEATINPEGEIESCTLISFVGDEQFAKQVCSLLDKRTWAKSLDPQGRAIYGRIRTAMRFTIPGTKEGIDAQRAKLRPDLELPFPANWQGTDELIVPVAVLIGQDGRVEACDFQPIPYINKHAREWADVACEGVSQGNYPPIVTQMGSIQRYVAAQRVRFSRAKP